jgi:uncharacterized glyoxalase superfamily protein PhnB
MGAPVVEGDNFEGADGPVAARLDMVVLSAHDLPRLRAFYLALGWEERVGASDSLATFDLGGIDLTLYPDASAPPPPGSSVADRSGATLVIRVGTPDQVNQAFDTALQAGATSVAEPKDQPWGGRSAVLADPEANRWELLWTPGAKPETPATAGGHGR